MTRIGLFSPAAALAAALVFGGAAGLAAQERPLFEWSGRVDREVRLTMRDGVVQARGDSRERLAGNQSRALSVLPREDGVVAVKLVRGRGAVDVVEQPTRANGYTLVVRIRDDASGAAPYRLSAAWRPTPVRAQAGRDRGDQGRHLGQIAGDRGKGDDRGRDERRGGRDEDRRDADRGRDMGRNQGAPADERGTLSWRGTVDDQVEIHIQGRDVSYVTVSGNGTRDARSRLQGGLPRHDALLRVDKRQGRGQVLVAQQPSAANGYTAIVRVRDASAGTGYYDFDVSW